MDYKLQLSYGDYGMSIFFFDIIEKRFFGRQWKMNFRATSPIVTINKVIIIFI